MSAQEPPKADNWVPGCELIANISKNIIEHVRIVRDVDDEFFFQDALVALTPVVVTVPSYYCVVLRTGSKLWIHQDDLSHPRARPYYGPRKRLPRVKNENQPVPKRRSRKPKQDHQVPMTVAQPSYSSKPDPNTTYFNESLPQVNGTAENPYKDFIRRGKVKLIEEYYEDFREKQEKLGRRMSETEAKMAVKDKLPYTKELEIYLAQCWRYHQMFKKKMTVTTYDSEASYDSDNEVVREEQKPVVVHITWCIVCGTRLPDEELLNCNTCPSAYHRSCYNNWPNVINYRQNMTEQLELIWAAMKEGPSTRDCGPTACPRCVLGPSLSYGDIVWSKLGSWSWWPARVLEPGSLPSCLVTRAHQMHDWPLAYYGDDKNFAWSDKSRMCIFMPHHNSEPKREELRKALDSACDDYISIYLK